MRENEDICWFETGNRKSDLNQNWYKCEDKRQTMCFWKETWLAAHEERKWKTICDLKKEMCLVGWFVNDNKNVILNCFCKDKYEWQQEGK